MTTQSMDKDLRSIQQARDLAVAAREAMRSFQFASQAQVDRICEAMVEAAMPFFLRSARRSVEIR